MNNPIRWADAVREPRGAARASRSHRLLCIALACVIALPFGSTALSGAQANADPSSDQESSESAPANGDVSASTTVDVNDEVADGATSLASAEALHMPTFEELAGGGVDGHRSQCSAVCR